MAGNTFDVRIAEVARRFHLARAGKAGKRPVYPADLWEEVARLFRAGVAKRELCDRCGIGGATFSQAVGRTLGRQGLAAKEFKTQASSEAVKRLEVERDPALREFFEVVFPNGVVVRVGRAALDCSLLSRLKAC